MAGFGRFKLSDALPKAADSTSKSKRRGTSPDTIAEQQREAQEAQKARNASGSRRDRMVEIGRGSQQAGRQGGSS